jgi:hypothetical protein
MRLVQLDIDDRFSVMNSYRMECNDCQNLVEEFRQSTMVRDCRNLLRLKSRGGWKWKCRSTEFDIDQVDMRWTLTFGDTIDHLTNATICAWIVTTWWFELTLNKLNLYRQTQYHHLLVHPNRTVHICMCNQFLSHLHPMSIMQFLDANNDLLRIIVHSLCNYKMFHRILACNDIWKNAKFDWINQIQILIMNLDHIIGWFVWRFTWIFCFYFAINLKYTF